MTFLETSADRQKGVDKDLLFQVSIPTSSTVRSQENQVQVGMPDVTNHINGKVC